jgi:hypothetical protein
MFAPEKLFRRSAVAASEQSKQTTVVEFRVLVPIEAGSAIYNRGL